MLLQDCDGQILNTHSIAAGLDYPGVGPEHAYYQRTGRAQYVAVSDEAALKGCELLAKTEGIIPALEPAHAVAYLAQHARTFKRGSLIILGLSGRGDKDVETIAGALHGTNSRHV